jgi:glycyl-tRNA synthetase beta chain
MSDFLLELASEEIPARMQAAAAEQLAKRFAEALKAAGLAHGAVTADATPRRLWLFAADVAAASAAASEERKGPAATAPDAAIAGFLRSTGLSRDQLEERETPKGVVLFAHIRREGRSAAAILAEAIPAIVRDFDWPKSMRWGTASAMPGSPRWVRPLTGIVALLDDVVVDCTVHGITAGRETRGHRIHAPGLLSIDSASRYAAQLRAAKVIVRSLERRAIIADRASELAAAQGLSVIADTGLVAENAGLTEWPVPMLGSFDPAFLAVPREVIQLTMRTNQKYFALADAGGALAPNFICVANLEASDGGAAIIAGNERVLSARLSDAKFFWDQDVAAVSGPEGLAVFTPKLADIVFHEKLGTVADKVERVAALAEWLVTSGAVPGDAALARRAAELCKSDLVSATVGEFPEVQGIAGRYLALLAGEDAAVADAIRDHYKPVGQGDDVPTAPASVAVALADKLDTLVGFFGVDLQPTGSKDPFALRRAALGATRIVIENGLRFRLSLLVNKARILNDETRGQMDRREQAQIASLPGVSQVSTKLRPTSATLRPTPIIQTGPELPQDIQVGFFVGGNQKIVAVSTVVLKILQFLADRLSVQQREAGVRHELIDAVFALGGEDDLVRLLARVHALQAFVATDDGTNLVAGYKRAANILRIEGAKAEPTPDPSRRREGSSDGAHPADVALATALDMALPAAATAVAAEDFTAAMSALASLRAPVDAFFADVMVNDPDPAVRLQRLALLARFRDAVHSVADFSRIEG